MTKPYYSVVIPVYNEVESLSPLFNKLSWVFKRLDKPWEVVFVDDGSTDRSEAVLRDLQRINSEVKIVSFTRNFGQTAAFSAGIERARGDVIITMDADLQNDPDDIPKMWQLMKEKKADIVCGWRKKRRDSFVRTMVSQVANLIINAISSSPVHDLGCSLRLYKRSVIKNMALYGEMHRFIPILASATGAKIVEIPVSHKKRVFGKSKYGLIRTFKVLLDLVTIKFLTGFQTKPIYMFGSVGIVLLSLSFIAGAWVVIRRLFFGGIWVSPMLFIMTILFTVGVICILMGLLAEIQIRTWYEASGKKEYIIKKP